MNEEQIIKGLKDEGYQKVYVYQSEPNEDDPDHVHPHDTALVIVDGEIKIVMNGNTMILKPGNRVNIPKSTLHSGMSGPKGCKYIVAEGKLE